MSSAQIRTTHMTGVVTDLGIEMGKMLYWNRSGTAPERYVKAEPRPAAPVCRAGGHVFGGRAGRRCWLQVRGFIFVLPLALVLPPCRCPLCGLTGQAAAVAAAAPRWPPAGRRQPVRARCRPLDRWRNTPDLYRYLQARSMQTQLAPEYAARPDGQEAEAILRKCIALRLFAPPPAPPTSCWATAGRAARPHLPHQASAGRRRAHARHADAPGPVPDLPQLRKHLPQRRAVRPPGGHWPQDRGRKVPRPCRREGAALGAEGRPALAAVSPAMKAGQMVRGLLPEATQGQRCRPA